MAQTQLVRYSRPEKGEEHLRFVVLEDREDRVLMVCTLFIEWPIPPTEVVAKMDIVEADDAS